MDYEQLRLEILAERDSSLKALRREYKRRIRALKIAFGVNPSEIRKDAEIPGKVYAMGFSTREIYKQIPKTSDSFCWRDLKPPRDGSHKFSAPTMRACLARLCKAGIIEITETSSGRRPTRYRRLPNEAVGDIRTSRAGQ